LRPASSMTSPCPYTTIVPTRGRQAAWSRRTTRRPDPGGGHDDLWPWSELRLSKTRPEPSRAVQVGPPPWGCGTGAARRSDHPLTSEEHTSELQSRENRVCRL